MLHKARTCLFNLYKCSAWIMLASLPDISPAFHHLLWRGLGYDLYLISQVKKHSVLQKKQHIIPAIAKVLIWSQWYMRNRKVEAATGSAT